VSKREVLIEPLGIALTAQTEHWENGATWVAD
jgi:hypothetical protein